MTASDRSVRTVALAPPRSSLAVDADIVIPIESESVQICEDLHHIVCHAVTVHMTAVLAAA